MADIKNIDVFQTVTSVSFEVEPNTDIININKVTTTGYSGVPSLQDVTDVGASTTNPITANSFIKSGGTGANVLLDNGSITPLTSIVGTTNLTYTSGVSNGVVNSNTGTDATIPLADGTNAGLFSATEKTKLSGIASGAEVNVNADWNAVSGDAQILNKPTGLATTTYVDNKDNSQQLQLNYLDRDNSIFDAFYLRTIVDGSTVEASNQLLSSLAVLRNISYVNQGYTQQINADKFVKLGGAADEYLMADGSISTGGGGGGGATNLTTTQTISNFTINSNTGTDATVPLGNGSLAGATLNDYTTAEKNKLAGIATGAEVNVNADWNATSGDAQILNKPTIPSGNLSNAIASGTDTYTATIAGVTSYVDGAGYLIRFTNGNTQTCSININGLGARTLYRNNDGQLIGGDIQDLGEMFLVYSSALSAFKCIGTSPNDIIAYVTNAESITITKGQPVYAFGGVGDRMTVKLAYNTLDSTSAQTVGLVMSTSIAANQKGYIITQGLLDNLSTLSSPFIDGDTVYLGATAGTITRVKPLAPNHLVYLGVVTTASAGAAGRMYVKPQNGYELNELHDVALTNPPTNNDGLFYETSTDLWKNKSIATALGYTPSNDASVMHLAGNETVTGIKTFGTNLKTTIPFNSIPAIAGIAADGGLEVLYTGIYPNQTEISYVKGVTSAIQTQFSGKQATLQSTVNIKSINGTSILGSGDLTISGTGISSLNGLTGATQTFSTTTNTGTGIPAWTSSGTNHQLNIPIAGGATTTGLITGTSQQISGTKEFLSNPAIPVPAGNSGTCIVLGTNGGGGATGTLQIGDTTTYPDAQEIQRVKGVTSNIQTQFNNIQTQLDGKTTGTIIVTSGTSFTTPSTITTSTVFIIQLVGGGGGGGGGPLGTSSSASGAGAGGYVFERITGLSASTTYTCAIGTGGTGGAAQTGGTSGTSTTLTIGAATFTASGGGFGTAAQSAAGGAGGTGSATGVTPDIVISGQNGGDSLNTAASVPSGTGGSSPKGWGLGGSGVLANKNGYNATGYGAGGSGGKGVAASGGNGTQGIIYCQYFN